MDFFSANILEAGNPEMAFFDGKSCFLQHCLCYLNSNSKLLVSTKYMRKWPHHVSKLSTVREKECKLSNSDLQQ